MQVSLLRFLDSGEYRPVGSTRTLRADVRLVGATNQDLQQLAAGGRFRQDLLYRLNTVTVSVPPLRERTDDLPALIDHILHTLRVPGASTRTMNPGALPPLAAYSWPGNIRELRNVIERAVLLSPGTAPLTRDDIERALPQAGHAAQAEDLSRLPLDDIERRHIARVLNATEGNKTQAAKILRIDYKTLLNKVKEYGLGA
jgi:DNA-binding NtrC family response regulator